MKASFTLLAAVLAATASCTPLNNKRQWPKLCGDQNTDTGASAYVAEADYKDAILKMHNEARALHGAGPLTWSSELANFGMKHTPDCEYKHTSRPDLDAAVFGENIHCINKAFDMVEKAKTGWYDEELAKYDFSKQGFSMATGHFTQIVWKATTEVGCSVKKCGDWSFLKCNYKTPGNYPGEFEANVSPAK
ncbi:Helothermine [Arthrobotrys entomopaga]|nr:Helothermine [Arthrobotrys entomopaga]